MTTQTISLKRFLLALALAGLVLALLPVALSLSSSPSQSTDEPPAQVALNTGRPADPLSTTLLLTPALRFKLQPALFKQLLSTPGAQVPIIIMLRAQPDLTQHSIAAATTTTQRRIALVNELHQIAAQSQAGVMADLALAQQAGRASEIQSLWIINGVAARADRATILKITAREDVAFVNPDRYQKWVDTKFDPQEISTLRPATSVEWNIARIRADQVWSALNITGTGVVVANMDTGVDWQHPALHANYRGNNPKGLPNHLFSWFDATNERTVYPYDGYGHGTHTMGTLAGADGIGVAPGAQWIAARIFDSRGFALDSWIHAGFQWILAPGGDPARAPDVLNNSWGNDDGFDQSFLDDVRMLNAAEIDTYFSNGNAGPQASTVGAPASFSEAFGVGAVDDTDRIALFSSRGPSPWDLFKPNISAPGVAVLSSIPGGAYAKSDGTSMAAPHTAGVAALLRSGVAGLTITQTRYVLTTTASHLVAVDYPNNDYGWGRVDAFSALVSALHTGSIRGVVRRSDTGVPLPFALLHADSQLGTWSNVWADGIGRYAIYGAASQYTVTVSAFGYVSHTLFAVPIVTGTITQRDMALTPLPTGWVTGHVTTLSGTQLLTATLRVQNAPVTLTVHGVYSLGLPTGTYVLQMLSAAHRVVTAEVTIVTGQTVTQNFVLPDAPTILLVDSGRWYNHSYINYYRQALDDLRYFYDEWPIQDLRTDIPTTSTLRAYQVTIWSAPFDSPGELGAGNVLSDFLGTGGHLLLSGQDVGYFDDWWFYEPYYHSKLAAQLIADDATTRQLTGTHSFAGLTLDISGVGGAENQAYPDVIRSNDPALTEPSFDYAPEQSGGQAVGLCKPYRAVYLPFGFEAINNRVTRAEVLSRTFGIFNRAPVRNVFALNQSPDQLIAPAGSTATTTLELTNLDEVSPLTFTLSAQSDWSVSWTPTRLSLPSCQSQSITVTVHIPSNAARNVATPITVTANATGLPLTSTVLLAKTPASVLLVQDDRWYPIDAPYRSALAANGIAYDVWRVPTSWAGPEPAVPSITRLQWYPQVMWFTGYDWYQTLTPSNTQALQAYLQQGGRLLLSSQEFLSTIGMEKFKRQILGVMTATTDMTTALVSGVQGGQFNSLVQQPLNLPYPNYTDALAPQPDAQVELIGEHGWPVALSHDMGLSKTLFMAFGFEGLPSASQAEAMNRSVGYLSRLGRSSVTLDRVMAQAGEPLTATIVIANDGGSPIARAALTMTVPSAVTYLGGDALTWSGTLSVGQLMTRQVNLKLADAINAGTIVTLPVEFLDDDQAIRFTRTAQINVDGTQLALNYAPSASVAPTNQVVTWTLTVHNLGVLTVPITVTAAAPFNQTWIEGSLKWNVGLLVNHGDRLSWIGTLDPIESLTVTYRMTTPWTVTPLFLYGSASAATEQAVWQVGRYLSVGPYQVYLPVLRKAS